MLEFALSFEFQVVEERVEGVRVAKDGLQTVPHFVDFVVAHVPLHHGFEEDLVLPVRDLVVIHEGVRPIEFRERRGLLEAKRAVAALFGLQRGRLRVLLGRVGCVGGGRAVFDRVAGGRLEGSNVIARVERLFEQLTSL